MKYCAVKTKPFQISNMFFNLVVLKCKMKLSLDGFRKSIDIT